MLPAWGYTGLCSFTVVTPARLPAYTTVDTNCLSVGAAKDDGGGDDEQRCEIADDTERLGQIRHISISVP